MRNCKCLNIEPTASKLPLFIIGTTCMTIFRSIISIRRPYPVPPAHLHWLHNIDHHAPYAGETPWTSSRTKSISHPLLKHIPEDQTHHGTQPRGQLQHGSYTCTTTAETCDFTLRFIAASSIADLSFVTAKRAVRGKTGPWRRGADRAAKKRLKAL